MKKRRINAKITIPAKGKGMPRLIVKLLSWVTIKKCLLKLNLRKFIFKIVVLKLIKMGYTSKKTRKFVLAINSFIWAQFWQPHRSVTSEGCAAIERSLRGHSNSGPIFRQFLHKFEAKITVFGPMIAKWSKPRSLFLLPARDTKLWQWPVQVSCVIVWKVIVITSGLVLGGIWILLFSA